MLINRKRTMMMTTLISWKTWIEKKFNEINDNVEWLDNMNYISIELKSIELLQVVKSRVLLIKCLCQCQYSLSHFIQDFIGLMGYFEDFLGLLLSRELLVDLFCDFESYKQSTSDQIIFLYSSFDFVVDFQHFGDINHYFVKVFHLLFRKRLRKIDNSSQNLDDFIKTSFFETETQHFAYFLFQIDDVILFELIMRYFLDQCSKPERIYFLVFASHPHTSDSYKMQF